MSQLPDPNAFQEASRVRGGGLFADLISFMAENKKWWLVPILLVLGLLGVFLVLGATGGAPFIYVFF